MKRTLCILLSLMLAVTGFAGLCVSASAAYNVGDIIKFGSYPQSEVKDSSLIDALNDQSAIQSKKWHFYPYYSGDGEDSPGNSKVSDFMEYIDINYGGQDYRGVRFSAYRPSWIDGTHSANDSYQDDNGYFTGTTYWFLWEPLQWRILDPNSGLVLCETIIDCQPFNNYRFSDDSPDINNNPYVAWWGDSSKTYYANNYAKSPIRVWLMNETDNSSFLNTAFTPAQRDVILNTTLDNSASNTSCSAYDGASTTDKIFLLSWRDIQNKAYGLDGVDSNGDSKSQAQSSDYAKCQGLAPFFPSVSFQCPSWWLRTPGITSFCACYVSQTGIAYNFDRTGTIFDTYGIRPAMRLKSLVSSDLNAYDQGINVFSSKQSLVINPDESILLAVCIVTDGGIQNDLDRLAFINEKADILSIDKRVDKGKGFCYITIEGKDYGIGFLQINDTKTGETVRLPISVVHNRNNAYTIYNVPVLQNKNNHKLNFANFSGMYIDDFTYKTFDGYKMLSFNVFNTLDSYGTVTSYDTAGELYDIALIKKHKSNSDSLYSGLIEEPYKLIKDIVDGDVLTYRQHGGYSEESNISIKIPDGGYLEISNDPSSFPYLVAIMDAVDIFYQGASFIRSITTPVGNGWEDSKDACFEDLLKSFLLNKQIDIKNTAHYNFQTEVMKDLFFEKKSFCDNYEIVCEYLSNLPIDIRKVLEKSVGTTVVGSIESVFEAFAGSAGHIMKYAFDYNKYFNIIASMQALISTENSGVISIRVPDNKNTMTYNEVTVQQDAPFDGHTTVESYILTVDDPVTAKVRTVVANSMDVQEICRKLNVSPEEYLQKNPSRLYDITMIRDGAVVQPDSSITVYLNVPDELRAQADWFNKLRVYRIESDGSLTDMRAQYSGKDDLISFTTDHFSLYLVLCEEWIAQQSTITGIKIQNLPKTEYKYRDALDTTGLELVYIYSDGHVEAVTNSADISVTGYNRKGKIGTQTLTVSCQNYTTTYTINVRLQWYQLILYIWDIIIGRHIPS